MSTRGLCCIVANGEYCVAVYNGHDSYPSYGGRKMLEFLRSLGKDGLEKLRVNSLTKVKLIDDADCTDGLEVFNKILNAQSEVGIYNDLDFAADSLFCEWCYLIDFDRRTFEVYNGFNTFPLKNTERFYFLNNKIYTQDYPPYKTYYPIKMVKAWPLDALPTVDEFEKFFEQNSDEQENEQESIPLF